LKYAKEQKGLNYFFSSWIF